MTFELQYTDAKSNARAGLITPPAAVPVSHAGSPCGA